MRFSVGIVGRGKVGHFSCFEDFASAVAKALKDLGHEISDFDNPGRIIAFGANNMRDVDGSAPKDMIVYNSEQLAAVDKPTSLMWAHDQLRERVVWDYSKANIAVLKSKLGIERAVHCPVSYHPSMTCIEPVANEDIDVLFYGSTDKWRRGVLNALEDSGLKVKTLFGVYGKERDAYIARSKVVLNLHFYKSGIFEIFRCSHLFANRKCVVTEGEGRDVELETLAKEAACYVPRKVEAIVEACRAHVSNNMLRLSQAERGFEVFKRTLLVDSVRKALEQS